MERREVRVAAALVAGLPALALLVAGGFTEAGPRGLFQADLVALVLAVGCGALALRARRLVLAAVPVGAEAVGLAHADLVQSIIILLQALAVVAVVLILLFYERRAQPRREGQ